MNSKKTKLCFQMQFWQDFFLLTAVDYSKKDEMHAEFSKKVFWKASHAM